MIAEDARRASHARSIRRARMVAQLHTAAANRRAASGAGNTSGGSCTAPPDETGRKCADPMMVARESDEKPQARGVLFDATPTITPPPTARHWYVDATDYPGYCAACGLPRTNRRHAPRWAA